MMNADRLTIIEAAIVCGWAEGLRDREIARRLHLSVHTVRSYGKRIRGALGVHTAAGAVGEWERWRRG